MSTQMDTADTRVADYIAGEIVKAGIHHVFGYQGGNITHLVDAVSIRNDLCFIETCHEQGAAFAANGYAQVTGGIGVAVASSGPGALNLLTGVANAYFDSVATLFISGDISQHQQKCGLPMRQDGFQGTDIISIVRPITKYAEIVQAPGDIRNHLDRALYAATHGRRGPVYLSIPHWVQRSRIDVSSLRGDNPPLEQKQTFSRENPQFEEVLRVLKCSRRPLLLLGGGANNRETRAILHTFLKHYPIPAVASLFGLSVLPHDHPSFIGFIGDYGNRHANLAMVASDCLIVLGSRMDERQVSVLNNFQTNKTVLHVDIDPSELFSPSEYYIPIHDSALSFLNTLNEAAFEIPSLLEWKRNLEAVRHRYPVLPSGETFTATGFLRRLSDLSLPDAQIFVDVGLHQMCAAQSVLLTDGKALHFSGGLGSMGYALPAAIGGHFAQPDRQMICISGDGGIMMNLQELQVVAREQIDIKVIVINNNCLGMIRELQRKILDGRMFGSVVGYQPCNLEHIAAAFRLPFHRLASYADMDSLSDVFSKRGSALIEVVFPQDMQPFPSGLNYPLKEDFLFSDGASGVEKDGRL